ncbi:MAG: hypothetical protein SR1Q7_08120 [Quinella sp. 1Q7]|nr:hypothetical protein [Quinella sp. 1Q7]
MATREENLKKINTELEAMSDEELSMVAGGKVGETSDDSDFLCDYGLMDHSYNDIETSIGWPSVSAEVDAGWAKAGITCVTKPSGDNQYFMGGQQISRDEAHKHVITHFKKKDVV